MSRYQTYKKHAKYMQKIDTRHMDDICKNDNVGFKLLAQQEFLRDYMINNPEWKSLLLYHKIGSGKTCSAITMAEQYLNMHPQGRIKVILPARLKTNFIDELMSPCAGKYISEEELRELYDSTVSDKRKKSIKAAFIRAISSKYEIFSFEKLKIKAKKSTNLITWAREFSEDSLILIDEVHNLISDKYSLKAGKEILKTGIIPKGTKGFNTILLKVLTRYAHSSSKFVFLTATPIFDNITQSRELVNILVPHAKLPLENKTRLRDLIDLIRGHVSYFPGTSQNAYPAIDYQIHEVPLSQIQDKRTAQIQAANEMIGEDEDSEMFMAKQRQVSISYLSDETFLDNIKFYAPKIAELVQTIEKNPGKHIVFSNFIEYGLKLVAMALQKRGWVNFPNQGSKGKTFAFWDGNTRDVDKQQIKAVVNNINNMNGDAIRVILGSPSIKEGVSFKHIQHLHLLDPVWNTSAKDQVEGRAVRFCSHVDIPVDHPVLKRKVIVHIYKIMPRNNGQVTQTCDQTIYDEIIPKKAKLVQAAERALQKVAIDHYLFRGMTHENWELPKSPIGVSVIEHDENANIPVKRGTRNTNTCPKKKRPINDKCPDEDMEARENSHGHMCCYQKKGTCPSTRKPPCRNNWIESKNKSGYPCCIKAPK